MSEPTDPAQKQSATSQKSRKQSEAEKRQARLAEALRENLRRRKGQARDRRDD